MFILGNSVMHARWLRKRKVLIFLRIDSAPNYGICWPIFFRPVQFSCSLLVYGARVSRIHMGHFACHPLYFARETPQLSAALFAVPRLFASIFHVFRIVMCVILPVPLFRL